MDQWLDPATERGAPGEGRPRLRHLPARRRGASTYVQTRRRTGETSL